MIVTTAPVSKVVVDQESFADITPVPVLSVNWTGEGLEIMFASDLTPAEALAVKARAESSYANEETLRNQAIVALQGNRDFLAIVTPTQAQVLAQVKALSRQNNGIIRQLLGLLDGTD